MEFAGGAVRHPGKTGHQLADLEPVWQYTAPGGPREIYYAYQILRYSGHQHPATGWAVHHRIGKQPADYQRRVARVSGAAVPTDDPSDPVADLPALIRGSIEYAPPWSAPAVSDRWCRPTRFTRRAGRDHRHAGPVRISRH